MPQCQLCFEMSSVGVASATKRTTTQLTPFGSNAHSYQLQISLSVNLCQSFIEKSLDIHILWSSRRISKLFLSIPEMRLTPPVDSVAVTPAQRDEASGCIHSWSPGMHLAHLKPLERQA